MTVSQSQFLSLLEPQLSIWRAPRRYRCGCVLPFDDRGTPLNEGWCDWHSPVKPPWADDRVKLMHKLAGERLP